MLDLKIADENSIEVPKQLCCCDLSLEEIGALVCLMSATGDVPEGMDEASHKRFASEAFLTQFENLRKRKIVQVGMKEGGIALKVDLDVIIDIPFKG